MRKLIIKSAIALTSAQKDKLEKGLSAGEADFRFEYVIDAIVGGIVIVDGEKQIDASHIKELNKLKNASGDILQSKSGIAIKDVPKLLKAKLGQIIDNKTDVADCGKVIGASDGVISISGLMKCQYGELIMVGKEGYALAMNLEEDRIGAILLSDLSTAQYGDLAYTTGKILEVPVGEALLGRVVNPLGMAMDGGSAIRHDETRRIEMEAPRILDRQPVKQPMPTGILAIDSMVPIGKGQRELIIGDRQTGKTSIAIDTIINQRGKDVYCVYVAIGQRSSAVSSLIATLKAHDAMSYTTIVLSTASDNAPLQYLAPYAGVAIAEHFMHQGKDVLIVYDDLSKHAVSYRAISLLLKRPAGREAYPGDIFYLHSKLLERAAKLSDALGGGSLTALPIIETQAGDISAYIPTNVISITDGQIYLEGELFKSGQRPAINVGLSVSRVGGSAQTKLMRKLSSQLRLDIAHYRELAIFAQFGSSLDTSTRDVLLEGAKKVESLKQAEYNPLDTIKEEIFLFAVAGGYLKSVDVKNVKDYLEAYYSYISATMSSLIKEIVATGDMSKESAEELAKATKVFTSQYTAGK